jgi:hypothetical protein
MEVYIWIGILLCLTQSAIFSGLNLAYFSLSRLRLEAEAATGNKIASKVLGFRRDSNLLLTTILWGNVSINVLLTLLSNSVLAGASAFLFSTIIITLAGEIAPQAYFSRRALKVASFFAPVMKFYQFILYPVARPSAWILDKWLGKEAIEFLQESQLKGMIHQHIKSDLAEVDFIEGRGALNFLDIDDISISLEGELVHPESIIQLPTNIDLPIFPTIHKDHGDDEFIRKVNASGEKWVIIADPSGEPKLLLDSDAFLRAVQFQDFPIDPYLFCHRPIVIRDLKRSLGDVIIDLKFGMDPSSDSAIDNDIVLLWTPDLKRVVTGADILGRLLHGIT